MNTKYYFFNCKLHVLNICTKLPMKKIKEILVGNWTSGNGIAIFSKEGKFEEHGAT